MKVEKRIESGSVVVEITLNEEEQKTMIGVGVQEGGSSWTVSKDNPIKNFACLLRAHYGSYKDIPLTLLMQDNYCVPKPCFDLTAQQILEIALKNYDAILQAKADAHALCGVAECVSQKSAVEFLATENRLLYRTSKGQIKPIE
jgi:hypothetical protein